MIFYSHLDKPLVQHLKEVAQYSISAVDDSYKGIMEIYIIKDSWFFLFSKKMGVTE